MSASQILVIRQNWRTLKSGLKLWTYGTAGIEPKLRIQIPCAAITRFFQANRTGYLWIEYQDPDLFTIDDNIAELKAIGNMERRRDGNPVADIVL